MTGDLPAEVDAIFDRLPLIAGRPRDVTPLAGGLTNHNYKVVVPDGAYVVRVSPRETDLLAIDRRAEHFNSVAAAEAGVGAPVLDYLPGEGVMVVGFIDGVTFTDEHLQRDGVIQRVASACRQLHAGPRFTNDFNMFVIQPGYLRIVQERGFRLPAGYLDFADQVGQIRSALAAHPEPTVPCNNDLLAGNFVDDGEKLWLIDYEYSGNNDPCFELGNIWSECHLSEEQLDELVTAYYGREVRSRMARARLQGLMSRYGWTLWASIQTATSSLDFDFWSWGMLKFEAAREQFTSPSFENLLVDVRRTD
ncbi:Thiamine kinase [Frankineae bacterium MT45]|nr:Thiamine kinase [Frankineae bacterium MT45]